MVPSAIPGQDVTATQLKEALMWGVAQWTSNDILSSSDEQCSDFEMKVGESEATDLRAGYDWHHPEKNRNLVVFRRGATHLDSDTWFFARSAIAMTTVTFVRSTGEILDADIELNDQDFLFTDCEPDTDATCDVVYDLKNTLTHELGHVLGLDHPLLTSNDVRDATMYGAAPREDIKKRDLADDDIEGLCAIYPKGQETPGNCTPHERDPLPNIKVSEVQGCQQVKMSYPGYGLALCFCLLGLGRKKYFRVRAFTCGFLVLIGLSTGCSQRTTNTWEQEKKSEQVIEIRQPQGERNQVSDSGVPDVKGAFFKLPQMISSPARGRLAVLRIEVAPEHAPLLQIKGTWGADDVSAMPWDKSKRIWQILFATPVGEKAQQREMILDGVLENGTKVRFVKNFLIDNIVYEEEDLKVSKKYISLKRKTKKRVKRERALLKNLWTIDTTRRYWQGNFYRPSVNDKRTGEFGLHRIYNKKRKSRHLGVDWDGRVGDLVSASHHGRVMLADELYYSGNTVVIDHGRGLFTLYFHLSEITVKAGDIVYQKQNIGKVGATGQVTGPHLHFAAKLRHTYIDPLHLLSLDFSQDPSQSLHLANP